jgi:hypothetical protein
MDINALEAAWADIAAYVDSFGEIAKACKSEPMKEEAGLYLSEKLLAFVKDIVADENAPVLIRTAVLMSGK